MAQRKSKRSKKRPGSGLVASARQSASAKTRTTPKKALSKLSPTPLGIKGFDHTGVGGSVPLFGGAPGSDAGYDPPQMPFTGFSAPPEELAPGGWLGRMPALAASRRWDDPPPPQCVLLRGLIAAWVAEGMRLVHDADTADGSQRTVAFAWGHDEVRTHESAVQSAVAVLVLAETATSDYGYTLLPAPREATPGLIKDLPVSVSPKDMKLMCVHYDCEDDDGDGAIIDINADWDWPSAAAAIESWIQIL